MKKYHQSITNAKEQIILIPNVYSVKMDMIY